MPRPRSLPRPEAHTEDVTNYTHLRRDDLVRGGVLSLHRINADAATAATWNGIGWVPVSMLGSLLREDDMTVTQISEAEALEIAENWKLVAG